METCRGMMRTEAQSAPRAGSAIAAAPAIPPTITIAGVRFHPLIEAECVACITQLALAGRGGWVVTPNLDILRQCVRDPGIQQLVSRADLVVCDGTPILLASHLQGTPLPGKVCGSNLINSLPAAAARAGLPVYLLGGAPGTADEAARVLRARHPELQLVGTHCPPFGFEQDEREIARIAAAIAAARPRIVFVALSFPKGERLIERIRDAAPDAWWVGVGISFSFLCGHVRRAPRWMQHAGLEWVFRLTQEPRRLAQRYLVQGLPFGAELVLRALAGRFSLRRPTAQGERL
jgi:N-acetylglucosaminyldiphosphoundecaprenol N-acetyl-beta-D-mannosaminyltransferase